jgi:hypothetical protein
MVVLLLARKGAENKFRENPIHFWTRLVAWGSINEILRGVRAGRFVLCGLERSLDIIPVRSS